MKSKSFVKLLRKIIREEVSLAVRQVLNESSQVDNINMNLSEISEKPNLPKKKFSKNSMLNDILNETAATAPSKEMTDWSSMNFKSEMAESFSSPQRPVAPIASTGINGEPVNMNNEGVAATVNAMTKDYSAVMAAMRKKDEAKGKKVV